MNGGWHGKGTQKRERNIAEREKGQNGHMNPAIGTDGDEKNPEKKERKPRFCGPAPKGNGCG